MTKRTAEQIHEGLKNQTDDISNEEMLDTPLMSQVDELGFTCQVCDWRCDADEASERMDELCQDCEDEI